MKVKAALLRGAGQKFEVTELRLEGPREGEVLVKLAASGVCHSDYHLVTGDTEHPLPVVAGHEGAGVVAEVGAGVAHVKVGDPVVLSWAPYCGHCAYCQRGQTHFCATFVEPIWQGTMLDGTPRLYDGDQPVYHYCCLATFAEYTVVPASCCIPIGEDIPLASAALVGCAVATGVGAAIYTTPVKPGETVAVYGCGGVGLNVVQGAALAGAAEIIAVDVTEEKMALARQFGATAALLASEETEAEIKALTGGWGVDHVFDATGYPAVQERALRAARIGGSLTLVGLAPMSSTTQFASAVITRQELTIRGSYYGTVHAPRDFPLLLNLYKGGKLKLDELITETYQLEEINEAYDALLTGKVGRGVILFD
ncbi:MAG TPA: Zn-dependent alcohol dehydrogenase [Anaerolineae bacterium]|nr:Zn-dependent alcohol dehydrogenase [Anaerolineae bacterium]